MTYHRRTKIIPCKDAKDCPETGNPCPYADDYGGELCRNTMCSVHFSMGNYTKSYRNKHWRKCRFGLDPRKCGGWKLKEGADGTKETDWFWHGCYATRTRDSDGELHNYCMIDDQRCDAQWIE